MLPWKCHYGNIMKLCADCNNCTKFQFFTEKVLDGDIPSFVMLLYIILCPQCDVTSHLICINQNLE